MTAETFSGILLRAGDIVEQGTEADGIRIGTGSVGKEKLRVVHDADGVIEIMAALCNGKFSGNECKIDGKDALWFQVETKIYGVDYLYLVAVAVDDDTVKVIEAKGKKKELLSELSIEGWKTMLESIRF